ncbi:hypothetical protein [Agriterribacter sp.]|nr:hypothetical protein [Agriterribacter sp.]HRP55069.1 hypothetical protein [Agriterribacter sp.]
MRLLKFAVLVIHYFVMEKLFVLLGLCLTILVQYAIELFRS